LPNVACISGLADQRNRELPVAQWKNSFFSSDVSIVITPL